MTFREFERQVREVRPEISHIFGHADGPDGIAYQSSGKGHGVGIEFVPGGRVYIYRGGYANILARLAARAKVQP